MSSLLILCSDADTTAVALAQYLRHHRGGRVELVTTRQLANAPGWRIRLGRQAADWQIHLTDGRQISREMVGAIYCRLDHTLAPYFADPTDAEYANMEFQAMVSGWLRNAGVPVVNSVAPVTLGAVPMNPWLRRLMLARAGLPVAQTASVTAPQRWRGLSRIPIKTGPGLAPIRTGLSLQEPLSDDQTAILMAGNKLVGPLADCYRSQMRQLQAQLPAVIVQVTFSSDQQGTYRAVDFQTIPMLSTADEVALLAEFLADFLKHATPIPHDSYSRHCL